MRMYLEPCQVHTVRLSLSSASCVADIFDLVERACAASGDPELAGLTADIVGCPASCAIRWRAFLSSRIFSHSLSRAAASVTTYLI